jgi:hypothetical protein
VDYAPADPASQLALAGGVLDAMGTFFAILGSTVGGWIGWVVGGKVGFMTAYMTSVAGSAAGVYYGRRFYARLLD